MTIFTRVYEKIMGLPHRHHNLEIVNNAAQDLRSSAQQLRGTIKPYMEARDPLETFMLEVWNKKQMKNEN